MLQGEGYVIEEADNGLQALALARTHVPDVIITDLEMPDLNGLALARLVRADARFARVGIIILTSHGEDDRRLAGLDQGVDEYLTKPGRPREVKARIRNLLRLGRALASLQESNAKLEAAQRDAEREHARALAAEKVSSFVHLSAGLTHEFNNSLAPLIANTQMIDECTRTLLEQATPGETEDIRLARADLSEVVGENLDICRRLARLTEDVASLQLLRGRPADTISVDLRPLVDSALEQASRRAPGRVAVAPADGPILAVTSPLVLLSCLTRILEAVGRAAGTEPIALTLAVEGPSAVLRITGPLPIVRVLRSALAGEIAPSAGRMTYAIGLSVVSDSLATIGARLQVTEDSADVGSVSITLPAP